MLPHAGDEQQGSRDFSFSIKAALSARLLAPPLTSPSREERERCPTMPLHVHRAVDREKVDE
jgi:hypothetical protein